MFPRDAAAVLGLGHTNGGQEHAGTSKAADAIALLRGVEEACAQLRSFPDYFAAQLAEQDRRIAQRQPARHVRTHIRGSQRLVPVQITPGDSLQAIAARVGVPWETLAMVNNLTYPYLVMEPATLTTGRMSSADQWSFSDTHVSVTGNAYQGQRVDLLSGAGAGQSRVILRNTATLYQVDRGWTVMPNDTTDYAIRSAANPILQTGTVTSRTTQTLTDSALALVPDAQDGLTVWIATGPEAGERRRIVTHDATTYVLDEPWDVLPAVGSIYLILAQSRSAGLQQKLLGATLNVPRPSAEGANPSIRSRVADVAGITGQPVSQTEKLFGRDVYLDPASRSLIWDPVTQDVVTIAGLANLRQAVIHLVNLPLGQLEYAPGLGSYVQEELGSTARMATQIQLLHSVERTIRQDARIARLGGVNVFTQGGRTFLSVSATATSGDMVERVTIR
jgi:phage baseplate assembly protein W